MANLIELKDFNKVFSTEEVDTHALQSINLTVEKGEYVVITGPSGCGKSTLLSMLGLLDNGTSGLYRLGEREVSGLTASERAAVRNTDIGVVFQSFNLISDLTVEENVSLPMTYRKDISKAERQKRVDDALDKVDMSHRKRHYPSQLSGGQQQRVAVARAIAGSPLIILADEPTGNLDIKNAQAVLALFDKLNKQGTTICMVSHDAEVSQHAKRVVRMLDGCIESDRSQSEAKVA
ncbi:ABC transporter ATP-binding protein [Shewanella sp.]|uniref:ABC transporter ATP-binding protein n=1 Tax=Shewanella sp. TaxID=50422 RepID=UPI004053E9C9